MRPRSPAFQADALLSEPPGKSSDFPQSSVNYFTGCKILGWQVTSFSFWKMSKNIYQHYLKFNCFPLQDSNTCFKENGKKYKNRNKNKVYSHKLKFKPSVIQIVFHLQITRGFLFSPTAFKMFSCLYFQKLEYNVFYWISLGLSCLQFTQFLGMQVCFFCQIQKSFCHVFCILFQPPPASFSPSGFLMAQMLDPLLYSHRSLVTLFIFLSFPFLGGLFSSLLSRFANFQFPHSSLLIHLPASSGLSSSIELFIISVVIFFCS